MIYKQSVTVRTVYSEIRWQYLLEGPIWREIVNFGDREIGRTGSGVQRRRMYRIGRAGTTLALGCPSTLTISHKMLKKMPRFYCIGIAFCTILWRVQIGIRQMRRFHFIQTDLHKNPWLWHKTQENVTKNDGHLSVGNAFHRSGLIEAGPIFKQNLFFCCDRICIRVGIRDHMWTLRRNECTQWAASKVFQNANLKISTFTCQKGDKIGNLRVFDQSNR